MHTNNIVYLDWPSYFSVYNRVPGTGYICYFWLRVLFGRKGSSGFVTGCGGQRLFLDTWRGWGGIWMRSLFSLFPFFGESINTDALIIARPPHQPQVILCGIPELGWAPPICGCWQINYILANIGHRNSIRIFNQYPFWWNISIQWFISFIKFLSFFKLRLS